MTKLTPRSRKKPVRLTKSRQAKALALLESGEFVCDVADQIGVTRQAIFKLRKSNKAFGAAWDKAAEIGDGIQASLCEQEMDFRGRIGWLEPKFYEGQICGFVKKYSDALLLARMKRLDPENYSDKSKLELDANVNTGGAVVVPGQLTPDTWQETIDQYDKLGPPPLDIDDDDDDEFDTGDDG